MKEKKKNKPKKILGIIVLVVFTAAIFLGLDVLGIGMEEAMDMPFLLYISLVLISTSVAYVVHAVIHELGHVIFGSMTGYKFVSIRIFSFVFLKTENGIVLKRYVVPGTAGQAQMAPPSIGKDEKMPYVLYYLGGGILNLLFTVFSVYMNMINDNVVSRSFFTLSIVVGLMIAVISLFPYSKKGKADACNILKLHGNKKVQKTTYRSFQIWADLAEGKSWSELDDGEELDLTKPLEELDIISFMIRYNKYYEMLEFDKAYELRHELEKNHEKDMEELSKLPDKELLFLELVGENRKEVVEPLYTKVMELFLKRNKYELSNYRVRMAYDYFYKQDSKSAIKVYEEGIKMAKKNPFIGDARMEVGVLDYIKERMEKTA